MYAGTRNMGLAKKVAVFVVFAECIFRKVVIISDLWILRYVGYLKFIVIHRGNSYDRQEFWL